MPDAIHGSRCRRPVREVRRKTGATQGRRAGSGAQSSSGLSSSDRASDPLVQGSQDESRQNRRRRPGGYGDRARDRGSGEAVGEMKREEGRGKGEAEGKA